MNRRRILYLIRQPPTSGFDVVETLQAALTSAAFDQEVALLFKDAGVQALVFENGATTQLESIPSLLAQLSEFGIQNVYACTRSCSDWEVSVEKATIDVQAIDPMHQGELLSHQHAVITD